MSERESDYLAGIINRRLTLYLRYRLPLRWREASEPGDRGGRGVERANGDERRGSYIYIHMMSVHTKTRYYSEHVVVFFLCFVRRDIGVKELRLFMRGFARPWLRDRRVFVLDFSSVVGGERDRLFFIETWCLHERRSLLEFVGFFWFLLDCSGW